MDTQEEKISQVEQLLDHFEILESQFQQVRDGLTHSHRLSTLGTIASIIAHEYNNILTPVISYAQLAQAKPNDIKLAQKAIEKAMIGAQRAAAISSSLLGFARESDSQHVAKLGETVDEAIACLGREPRQDGIELTLDLPDVLIAMSPLNLQQVMLNIILNAMKAMKRGRGALRISANVRAQIVHIDIADTGPGIPENIQNRLFEPFVTQKLNDKDPKEHRGTGLGLCICRDLVKAVGGEINFTSRLSQGTTFHLKLPLADDLFINDAM